MDQDKLAAKKDVYQALLRQLEVVLYDLTAEDLKLIRQVFAKTSDDFMVLSQILRKYNAAQRTETVRLAMKDTLQSITTSLFEAREGGKYVTSSK